MGSRSALPRLPLVWAGSKKRMARELIALMPEHDCYCEIFGGSAAVLFAKPPAKLDVLNDIDGELMNFYTQLKKDLLPFWESHALALASRKEFMKMKQPDASLTDYERAWRFYYLNRLSFAGKGGTYAVEPEQRLVSSNKPKLFRSLPPHLGMAHQRLQQVSLECLPWQECLKRFDRPGTLFYLDPPYPGTSQAYAGKFTEDDCRELAARLGKIRGRFLLSMSSQAKDIFHDFTVVHKRKIIYQVGGGEKREGVEVVYGN